MVDRFHGTLFGPRRLPCVREPDESQAPNSVPGIFMTPSELKERYQKLVENYQSGVIDWKAFEMGLLELKRLRAAFAASGDGDLTGIPDTGRIERMRYNAEQGRPNRFTDQGIELSDSSVSRRKEPDRLSMSTVPSSSFRVEPELPTGEGSGISLQGSKARKANLLRPQVGNILGERYTLQRSLGRGTFGETWRAKDAQTENYVVIKQLPISIRNDSKATSRFFDVFRRVTALKHHNICPVYFLDEDEQYGPFVVSAYLDAVSLEDYYSQYVRTFQTVPLSTVVRVLWPVAAALDYARERKTIHGGLKPNNVLVGKSCGTLITDVGLTETIRTSLLALGVTSGVSDSGPWRAPEVWRDGRYSPQSDQFSLAVLAYRMIADTLPFSGCDEASLRERVIKAAAPPIESESGAVNTALQRGLAKDPFDRFPSCLHFVKALIEPSGFGPHFSRSRILDARHGLWAFLFGIPRPEPPACVADDLWPFDDEELGAEPPDIRIPRQATYPYARDPMAGTIVPSSVFGIFSGTTTTIFGGVAAVSLGTGIALTALFSPSDRNVTPSTDSFSSDAQPMSSFRAPPLANSEPAKTSSSDAEGNEISVAVAADELIKMTEQAAAGDVVAQRKLGELYVNGTGVSTNYGFAIRYFRQAAEKDDATSLYHLGRCSELGLGVPVNVDLAKNYYVRAAKQGSRDARLALRRLDGREP